MADRVGAAVVVWRRGANGPEFLVLHRAGAAAEGPWCWTFPSGGCEPGEALVECAARELMEETGLILEIEPVRVASGYPVYRGEAPATAEVTVSDGEHDESRWLSLDDAASLVLPDRVADSLRAAGEGIVRQ